MLLARHSKNKCPIFSSRKLNISRRDGYEHQSPVPTEQFLVLGILQWGELDNGQSGELEFAHAHLQLARGERGTVSPDDNHLSTAHSTHFTRQPPFFNPIPARELKARRNFVSTVHLRIRDTHV